MTEKLVHEQAKRDLEHAEELLEYMREKLMEQENTVEEMWKAAACDHPPEMVINHGGTMELIHEECKKCGYSWTV